MKRLNRRTFLGGAGAAISLPMLEAMLPARGASAAQPTAPRRFVSYFIPCGVALDKWHVRLGDGRRPSDVSATHTERLGALSPTLASLDGLQDHLTVVSNLANPRARPRQGGGSHGSGTGGFLTGVLPKKNFDGAPSNGVSMDQRIAQHVRGQTRVDSLQLGMSNGGGGDTGYSPQYLRSISWSAEDKPLPKIVDPCEAFDVLFAGTNRSKTVQQRALRKTHRRSLLDYVREDAARLDRKLGATDRGRLDQYLSGIRDLELRIEAMEDAPQPMGTFDPPDASDHAGRPGVEVRARMMADLMATALESDSTRVITFMLGNGADGTTYDFLGANEGYHDISHWRGYAGRIGHYERINKWMVDQFAYFVRELERRTDVTGAPLLDSTLVFLSSEVADGNHHHTYEMPVVLAGRFGGKINPGRHVAYKYYKKYDFNPTSSDEKTFADLFLNVFDGFDMNVERFGVDGDRMLTELAS